jgi:hypothetical protein
VLSLREQVDDGKGSGPEGQEGKPAKPVPGGRQGVQILDGLNVEKVLAVEDPEMKKIKKPVKYSVQPENIPGVGGEKCVEISQRALDNEGGAAQDKARGRRIEGGNCRTDAKNQQSRDHHHNAEVVRKREDKQAAEKRNEKEAVLYIKGFE